MCVVDLLDAERLSPYRRVRAHMVLVPNLFCVALRRSPVFRPGKNSPFIGGLHLFGSSYCTTRLPRLTARCRDGDIQPAGQHPPSHVHKRPSVSQSLIASRKMVAVDVSVRHDLDLPNGPFQGRETPRGATSPTSARSIITPRMPCWGLRAVTITPGGGVGDAGDERQGHPRHRFGALRPRTARAMEPVGRRSTRGDS